MNRTLVCAVLLSLLPSVGTAEITPRQGDYDPRVRIVDYNPSNVVKLSTFYGVSTHVQFGEGENIHDVAVGDDQAWTIVPRSLSDLELYDSFPSSKRLKNDCHALIRPFMERFSTLMRLFLPFGQSYPASTWIRFKL